MRRARPGTRCTPTPAKASRSRGWRAARGAGLGIAFGLGLVGALAGCFDDKGLGIEVDVGDTHASKIELYLGKVACNAEDNDAGIDCSSIAPPDPSVAPPAGTIALRGDIWFRDSPLPYTADVAGSTAAFRLQADGATKLPIVVAVGFAITPAGLRPVGTAVLRDVEIPASGARLVTTTLAAAGAAVVKPTDTKDLTEDRVMVWTKQEPASSCVVVEHWVHGQVTRDFVVPAVDPDCDDVAAPECNPAAYRGSSAVGGAATRPECVAPAEERCVLGAFGCTEVPVAEGDVCVAPPQRQTCLPDPLCGCALASDCVQNALDMDPSAIAHIECDVPTSMALGICGGHDNDTLDLSAKFPNGCGRQPLLSSLQLTGVGQSHKFGTAELELSGASDACTFKITWRSGQLSLGTMSESGFVGLDLAEGGVLLPIVLHFHLDSCAVEPFHCELVDVPADSLWGCVP
jgi:hypothetical protein